MSASLAEVIFAAVPVAEVTLLEDRALVVRRGVVELPPGRARLVLSGVAPVLVDKTLSASLRRLDEAKDQAGEAELRVLELALDRRRVTAEAERPRPLAELEAERRARQAELRAANDALERTAQAHASVAELIGLTMAEINEDVGWGRGQTARWTEALDELDGRARALAAELERRRHEIGLIERSIADLGTLAAAHEHLDSEAQAELRVELLNASDAPVRAELRVDYLVPGALWRPWHSARLIEDEGEGRGARLEFRCDAAVWQATGEDWREVELRFSTERPSLGVSPPELDSDRLRMRKRASSVEVEVRDEKINSAGLGPGEDAALDDAPVPVAVAEDELPGIDDGGEAVELRARHVANVPADGRPHRVALFGFEVEAETALVCAPELAAAVILRSRQTNAADHPILAGPVDLVRHSGLVGRSSLLYVAPGERFELGWGPDPTLRVHRELEHREHERRMMSSWTRKPRRVSLKLSNIGPAPKAIEIKERIPVSEVEKVEVELSEASRGATADRDGFVTWNLRLAGFAHDELELDWVLVVHDDVSGL